MGFFRKKTSTRASSDEGRENASAEGRRSLRDGADGTTSPKGARSGELSENGSTRAVGTERMSQSSELDDYESRDTLTEFATSSASPRVPPGRKSLRRRSLELYRQAATGATMTNSKKALVDAAIDEIIADEESGEFVPGASTATENSVYRTMFHTVRRLVDLEASKRAHGSDSDPLDTLQAIANALSLANALILQIHGSLASKQAAVDLLDPVAKGFVEQFFTADNSSLMLAQNMAQLAIEMRGPRNHIQSQNHSAASLPSRTSSEGVRDEDSPGGSMNTIFADVGRNPMYTSWTSFDVYKFASECERGRKGPLQTLSMGLFDRFNLFNALPLDRNSVSNFIADIERKYRDNDYHNRVHATDVTQAAAYLIETSLESQIEPIHTFAMLVAAMSHDVGHPGVNNTFLVNCKSAEAERWNDVSVNENGHLFTAFSLLKKHAVLAKFTDSEQLDLKKWLQKMIMYTDMEFHGELTQRMLKEIKDEQDEETNSIKPIKQWQNIWVPLAFALHCADISNPARPYELALAWAQAVTAEFYKQGDRQRKLEMRVEPFMDRSLAGPASTQSNQLGFIKFVVKPSLCVLEAFMPAASRHLLDTLEENIAAYGNDVASAAHAGS